MLYQELLRLRFGAPRADGGNGDYRAADHAVGKKTSVAGGSASLGAVCFAESEPHACAAKDFSCRFCC
jgi:hypothetical protein